ncbi:forkhead box protein H1 [Notolabrus celidotus]|uniref:forkhead box protein H1 n=1 Tax=Notolabrus celidotus TaxID=1203425 RepID=UPI00148F4A48|nr:forkhead box protein H1 [Notolabrus celidotus]XP_034560848.1 forkhead box protein H1 [Notolabrus celidotus]
MQTKMGNCGSPASISQQRVASKSTTYLAKIAVVLQHAHGKMLTFPQLMDQLMHFICEDRRTVENNIRVCLSTNNCFVKIPMVPDIVDSKRNYWKLDLGQVTTKMVRRHFKGILHLFPELSSEVETENSNRASKQSCSAPLSPETSACRAVQIRCEVKFSGPFSIESLLKRDSPSAQSSMASPWCRVPVRVEQRVGTKRNFSWDSEQLFFLQASAGSSLVCSAGSSTHHGLTKPIRKTHVYSEPSFPYTRSTPHYNSPTSSYITHSVPAFTHDALRFCM